MSRISDTGRVTQSICRSVAASSRKFTKGHIRVYSHMLTYCIFIGVYRAQSVYGLGYGMGDRHILFDFR